MEAWLCEQAANDDAASPAMTAAVALRFHPIVFRSKT